MCDLLYELVKKAQQGDELALQQLIDQFEPKIKKVVNQLTVKDKEDLIQTIKVKLIEKIKHYDLDGLPGFWDFVEKQNNDLQS